MVFGTLNLGRGKSLVRSWALGMVAAGKIPSSLGCIPADLTGFFILNMNDTEGIREETWEAFIADALFIAKVEFSASYSSACIRSSQQFPELSITYSTKLLSFGIVDLGLFPNAAEKFGVSLSGSMGQLPTYILFENAAEVSRFPELGSETTFFNPTITKGLLSRHFELDRHLLEYVNSK
ncbi:hypothetical protein KIW84_061036 [Lathyrus oleraceus]|uniref:Uncharacterized protein n=1 Tax=Pisum sativum TaxID=3888 RepID=A0A9D4W1U8_PEA|nr:hypothetical protein KIW84_061036 [Pisum sativum]